MRTHVRAVVALLAIFVSACAPETLDAPTTEAGQPDHIEGNCGGHGTDVPWTSDVSATTVVLSEGDGQTPRVEAVRYPHPGYEGNPWSQWGQGLVLDDGRRRRLA